MPKPSKSTAPIAQLRRLLGVTATIFAKRHALNLDRLKKIESQRAKETLKENEAYQIALTYGLLPSSLGEKSGELLAIDGKTATKEKIDAWQHHLGAVRDETKKEKPGPGKPNFKGLALAAARQTYELFMAASDVGQALHLAAMFADWQKLHGGLASKLAIEARHDRSIISRSSKTMEELKSILGNNHPVLLNLSRSSDIPIPVQVSISRIVSALVEFRPDDPASGTPPNLIFGRRGRRYTIKFLNQRESATVIKERWSMLIPNLNRWKSLDCEASYWPFEDDKAYL